MLIYLFKMVIFHSQISLPKGIPSYPFLVDDFPIEDKQLPSGAINRGLLENQSFGLMIVPFKSPVHCQS